MTTIKITPLLDALNEVFGLYYEEIEYEVERTSDDEARKTWEKDRERLIDVEARTKLFFESLRADIEKLRDTTMKIKNEYNMPSGSGVNMIDIECDYINTILNGYRDRPVVKK
jgi:hypothetical protein